MQQFGVIGNPISHSLSPIIHNFLFSHLGIKAFYQKIYVPHLEKLNGVLDSLDGANITLPYKEEVFGICDEVMGIAKEIGAVNTIVNRDQKKYGFNTDALGFWKCVENLGIRNALILGAGGSAKAIAVMLQKMGVEVDVYAKNKLRHLFFIQRQIKVNAKIDLKDYDLLINATSAGLITDDLPVPEKILKELFCRSRYLFDVIYPSDSRMNSIDSFLDFFVHRKATPLIAYAQSYSIQTMDGLEMLLFQALLAFEIFFSKQYSFEELRALFYNSKKLHRSKK